jgi:hypothetical protein
LKSTVCIRRQASRLSTTALHQHAWERVAALPLVPLSVFGVWLESPRVQACDRSGCAHGLMVVSVSIDSGYRWHAAVHISSTAWAADDVAAWFDPGSNWLQFIS